MDKREIHKINVTFMNELGTQLLEGEKMFPYIILEDSVKDEVGGMVFVYTTNKEDNKPRTIIVRNDGRQLYFLSHSHITNSEYEEFKQLIMPNLALECLTADLEISAI